MSGKKLIANDADVVYLYDGSLAGFYTSVYESVYGREMPSGIYNEKNAEPSFFREKYIETDAIKAEKVRNSVIKISKDTLDLVECVFLSCLENKEMCILRFLYLAYENGNKALSMLSHDYVAVMLKAQKNLLSERHLLLGFIRFADYGGKLVAEISPKNFLLPTLFSHFIGRFPNEEFMIHDKTHKCVLIYQNKQKHIIEVSEFNLNEISAEEEKYQSLWKQFYKTIAIEDRYNPKCRMTNMPKRYWENMIEMKEFL